MWLAVRHGRTECDVCTKMNSLGARMNRMDGCLDGLLLGRCAPCQYRFHSMLYVVVFGMEKVFEFENRRNTRIMVNRQMHRNVEKCRGM